MYQNGTGVPQDINQPLRLYRQACEGGGEEACNRHKVQVSERRVYHDQKLTSKNF